MSRNFTTSQNIACCVLVLLSLVLARDLLAEHTGTRMQEVLLHASRTPLLLETDEQLLGYDGSPGWFWPDLPAGQVSYRRDLPVPSEATLRALLVSTNSTTRLDSCDIRLLLNGELLQTLLRVELDLDPGFQRIDLENPLTLASGSMLAIELIRENNDAPWITADENCRSMGGSSIRIGNGDYQSVDHNLNLRAVVEWAPDLVGPELLLPVDPVWCTENLTLSLGLRARDVAGVEHIRVTQNDLELDLQPVGYGEDDWQLWQVDWPLPSGLGADELLTFTVLAEDSLGNSTLDGFELSLLAGYCWAKDSGNGDMVWRQFLPALPGALSALRVPVSEIMETGQLLSLDVLGAQLRMRGEGQAIVHLVADEGGSPAGNAPVWQNLAAPETLSVNQVCAGWLDLAFEALPGADSLITDQVWILVEGLAEGDVLSPPAPMLEWKADTLAATDTLSCSYSYDNINNTWQALEDENFLIRALLGVQSCDLDLALESFYADFDQSFADFDCMTRVSLPASNGWLTSADLNPNSLCFRPQAAGALGYPDSVFDPDGIQNGEFLYISADHNDQINYAHADTLFLPVMETVNGASVSFSVCATSLGSAEVDYADTSNVLMRFFEGNEPGAWIEQITDAQMSVPSEVNPDTLYCGVHPLWIHLEQALIAPGTSNRFQLAFAYNGINGGGWAIDSLRIEAFPTASPSPWDGPQTSQAELGRVYPNPFNPATIIPYRVLESGPVRIAVYNLRGQLVETLLDSPWEIAGAKELRFVPGPIASGLYFVRLDSRGHRDTRRLLYMR